MYTEENRGPKPAVSPGAVPWIRWAARTLDISLSGALAGGLLGYLYPSVDIVGFWFFTTVLLLVYTVVEAVLLATWGTTPGKWLLNARVEAEEGGRLPLRRAWFRSFTIAWRGMGLGIDIFRLFAHLMAYNRFNTTGTTAWDIQERSRVVHGEVGAVRTIIVITLLIGTEVLAAVSLMF